MTTPAKPIPGPARYLIAAVALAVVGLVGGIGVGLLSEQTGPGALVATVGLITVTMAVALGGGVWWWARLDEAAREAHKWAWWWGGTTGIAIGSILLLTLMTRDDTEMVTAWAGTAPADIFGAGIAAILGFQLVGYSIGWVVWWLRRR